MKVEAGAVEAVSAQARKRRMERRAKTTKPSGEDDDHDGDVHHETKRTRRRLDDDAAHEDEEEEMASLTSSFEGKLTKDALAKIPGFKKQARYVPAVPMSKDELTMWRKEARRVRNRESAAASRQKTQKRIEELEEEVAGLTKKYEAALRRIVELEAAAVAANHGSNSSNNIWTCTSKKHQALHAASNDGAASPVLTPHTVSPPLSPREEPFSIGGTQEEARDEFFRRSTSTSNVVSPPVATAVPFSNSTMKYQQVINTKISRPNACVKIPNRAFSAVAAI